MTILAKRTLIGLVVTALFVLLWIFVALTSGCAAPPDATRPDFTPDGAHKVPRAALVVSLTHASADAYGGWLGDCAGTDRDAAIVTDALDRLGVPYLALEAAYRPGLTYREWFDAALPLVGGSQKPVMNFTGKDFSDKEAFR